MADITEDFYKKMSEPKYRKLSNIEYGVISSNGEKYMVNIQPSSMNLKNGVGRKFYADIEVKKYIEMINSFNVFGYSIGGGAKFQKVFSDRFYLTEGKTFDTFMRDLKAAYNFDYDLSRDLFEEYVPNLIRCGNDKLKRKVWSTTSKSLENFTFRRAEDYNQDTWRPLNE